MDKNIAFIGIHDNKPIVFGFVEELKPACVSLVFIDFHGTVLFPEISFARRKRDRIGEHIVAKIAIVALAPVDSLALHIQQFTIM